MSENRFEELTPSDGKRQSRLHGCPGDKAGVRWMLVGAESGQGALRTRSIVESASAGLRMRMILAVRACRWMGLSTRLNHSVVAASGRVLWILTVDEAADGDAVVLLLGQFSDELRVALRIVSEREVARAQPRGPQGSVTRSV